MEERSELKIVDVDYWEKDAILEVGDMKVYFQFDGEEEPTLADAIEYLLEEIARGSREALRAVNRFEVIDNTGRAYVKYLDKGEVISYSLQDDDRTLKVFIDKLRWKEDL